MSHFVGNVPIATPTLLLPLAWRVLPANNGFRGYDAYKFSGLLDRSASIPMDPQNILKRFLEIDTFDEGLGFFTIFGPMSEETSKNAPEVLRAEPHDGFFRSVLPFMEVERWQRVIWKVRAIKISELPDIDARSDPSFEVGDAQKLNYLASSPPVEIRVRQELQLEFSPALSVRQAIRVALHLEKLNGIRCNYCAVDDCRKPFTFKGTRDKKFCSYECSHKSAVRASRARLKAGK